MLVAGCRTPIGTAGHSLSTVDAPALAAPVLAEAARRSASLRLPITEVVLGNCLGPGGNVARSATLAAGLGINVPATTVDRQCGSGLEAVRYAAALVSAAAPGMTPPPAQPPTTAHSHRDVPPLVLAGGVESASTAPWRYWPPSPGSSQPPSTESRYTRAPFAPAGFPDPEMGPAADDLARVRGISRRKQDAYAARSYERAVAAMASPSYAYDVIPVGSIHHDERPRPMTVDRLTRLRPAFATSSARESEPGSAASVVTLGEVGTVTAGNASGISDGAAVVAVTTAAAASTAGMPAVSIVSSAVAAGDPALPGAAAGPAALLALRRAGIGSDELAVIEVVEAFAAVALAFADDLGVDAERLCAEGGAIAYGHPWGASGTIALVHAISQLRRSAEPAYGLVACAIGGGQSIAMVLHYAGNARS